MKTLSLNSWLFRSLRLGVLLVFLATIVTSFIASQTSMVAQAADALCEPVTVRAGETVPGGLYSSLSACEIAKAGTNPLYNCTSMCPHMDGCACPSTCVNKVAVDLDQTCGGNATTPTCTRSEIFTQNLGANSRNCVDSSGASKFECLAGFSFLPGTGRCVSNSTPTCESSQQCASTSGGAIGGQGCIDPDQGYGGMKYCCASGQFLVNGRCQGTANVPCYNKTTCSREMLAPGTTCSGNYSVTVPTTCECMDGANQECYPRPTVLTSCTASCPTGGRCTCPSNCARGGSISATDTVRTCSSNPLLESCRTTATIATPISNSAPCSRLNGTIGRECLSGYIYSNGQCSTGNSLYPPCPSYTNDGLANVTYAYRCSTETGAVTWTCQSGYNARRHLIGGMYCSPNGSTNTSPQFPQPLTNCTATCPAGNYCSCDSTCQNKTLITPESSNRACGGSSLSNCRGYTDSGLSGDANAESCNDNGNTAWQCRSGYNARRPLIGGIYCASNTGNTSPQNPQPLTNCTATCPAGNYCACAANCQNQSLITPESTNRACGGSTLSDCRSYSNSDLSGDTNAERCNEDGASTWQCRSGYNARRHLIGGMYCSPNDNSNLPACSRDYTSATSLGGNSRSCRDPQGNTRYECNANHSLLPGSGTCVSNSTPSCESTACTTQTGVTGTSPCVYNYSEIRYCCGPGRIMRNGQCQGVEGVMCYNRTTCQREARPAGSVCDGNYSATVPSGCTCYDGANQQCAPSAIDLGSCTASCPAGRTCNCPANCARSIPISSVDTTRTCGSNPLLPTCRTGATLPSTANGSVQCSRSNGTIGRECAGTTTWNGSQCATSPAVPALCTHPVSSSPFFSDSVVYGECASNGCATGQRLRVVCNTNGTTTQTCADVGNCPTPGNPIVVNGCNNQDSKWTANTVGTGGQCCGGGTLECVSRNCSGAENQLGQCLPPVVAATPTPSVSPSASPSLPPGGGGTPGPTGQPGTPQPTATPRPTCQYTYSEWTLCQSGLQNRQILNVAPNGCKGTPEPLVRACGDEFFCEADSDCPEAEDGTAFAFCYQPPMPSCPPGMACPQVMPRKECQLKKSVADINKDSSVNIIDLSVLLRNLLTTDVASDFNKDGLVDIVDYSWLIRRLSEKPAIDLINN